MAWKVSKLCNRTRAC